jgi:hypothetical protein
LTFTTHTDNNPDVLLLRRNGSNLELYDNGERVRSQGLNGLTAVQITGVNGEDDRLTVDYNLGGLFSVPITFNAGGAGGTDALVVNATNGNDTIALTTGRVTVNGNAVSFANIEQLQVNALAGADTVTETGTNPGTAITIDAGTDADFDTFTFNLAGNFDDDLTVLHFSHVEGHAGGDFTGHWTVQGSGTIDDLTVGGDMSGTAMSEDMTNIMIMGSVTTTGALVAHGSGTMDGVTVGGDVSGKLMSEDMTNIMVMGSVTATGAIIAEGSGTIDGLTVDGDVKGKLMSEDMTGITVMGDLSGSVTVMKTLDSTGSIGGTFSVGGNLSGSVSVDGTLSSLAVGGGTEGSVAAGDIGTISATGGVAGSPVLTVTEAGVTRKLFATRADNGLPTPATVVFDYFYDSTGPGNPQLSVKVTNGNPATAADDVRFDLTLTTSTAGGFDLARLFANGTSGVRDVAVEGNLMPAVSSAALAHFGLPAGTPGGVRLPLDALAAVAAQNNAAAGSVQAKSLMAVAFGSVTQNGVTTPGASATKNNAAALLAPGTATVRANDTFLVPFAEGQTVALFLVTGSSGFDARPVLFTDQITDNASVTAAVGTAAGAITSIQLQGDGGSIQTALPVGGPITSTGPLGDLALSSSSGIADVTAPSIFGNITTGGPIWGTIQTTAGDLGRALTTGGTITGTTSIMASAITGRVISRGNLVSRIDAGDFSGVIAAQGDIGVAYVNPMGQLVRFGSITAHSPSGSIVALGNMFSDFNSNGGFSARIAVKGRAIAGLAPGRFGILGGVNVSVGGMRAGSAVVSGGVIGDAAGGTFFSVSGAVKGIVAAKGDINMNVNGNPGSGIFENAKGQDAAAIDAIFTYNNGQPLAFDLTGLDLAGLGLILDDLTALKVGPDGHLTGPVP